MCSRLCCFLAVWDLMFGVDMSMLMQWHAVKQVLSMPSRYQILCSGLCNSAATSIVYLFTSFCGSDVNVETRCIVYRVNIHILICTLNVRETSDDWQTGILNISWTSRGFCGGCPWDLETCIVTMSVFVYDAVDLCKYSTKKIYVMFSLKCMSSGQKILCGPILTCRHF